MLGWYVRDKLSIHKIFEKSPKCIYIPILTLSLISKRLRKILLIKGSFRWSFFHFSLLLVLLIHRDIIFSISYSNFIIRRNLLEHYNSGSCLNDRSASRRWYLSVPSGRRRVRYAPRSDAARNYLLASHTWFSAFHTVFIADGDLNAYPADSS